MSGIRQSTRAIEALLDWLADEGGIDADVLESDVRPLINAVREATVAESRNVCTCPASSIFVGPSASCAVHA
jgi:hypothetical protein